MSNLKKIVLSFLITYFITEILYSGLFYFNLIEGDAVWFHEHTDTTGNFKFDPTSGYRISGVPATFGCYVKNGRLQSYGVLRGNNLGFPSKHDFYKHKGNKKRVIVFGDSYTASQFTAYSWVDLVEDYMNANATPGDSVEFWNMSVDGAGLANWWSVIHNVLNKEGFDADAMIFAVLNTDLDRSFHVRKDTVINNEWQHALYYSSSWNPRYFPKRADRIDYFYTDDWKILDSKTVKSILSTGCSPVTREKFDLKLSRFLYDFFRFKLVYYISNSKDYFKSGTQNGTLLKSQQELTEEMADYVKSRNIPVLVLGIYTTDTQKTRQFCKILHADFIDATSELYDPHLSIRQIEKKYNIKHDGHWNNEGVKIFAEYNKYGIAGWINKRVNENK